MTYCGSMYTIRLWCRYTKKQFSANSWDMIDIVVQVVCLLRAKWIVLMYVLEEWCTVSEKESATLKIF